MVLAEPACQSRISSNQQLLQGISNIKIDNTLLSEKLRGHIGLDLSVYLSGPFVCL